MMIPQKVLDHLKSIYQEKEKLSIIEWNEKNFRFPTDYDTQLRGSKYVSSFMPYFNEIANSIQDPEVKYIYLRKNSRIGASENIFLNAIRFFVSEQPKRILYVTATQDAAVNFLQKRVVKSLMNIKTSAQKLLKATRETKQLIDFEDMTLRCTSFGDSAVAKQDGYEIIFLDELSMADSIDLDQIKKRMENYAFPKLVAISSPNPHRKIYNDDPIFRETISSECNELDERRFFIPCPKCGILSALEFASRATDHGLKWAPDAKHGEEWNIEEVIKSTYYLMPCGHRMEENERMDCVRDKRAKWIPKHPEATKQTRSYSINALYSPFLTLGDISSNFLLSNARGTDASRTFFAEYMAERYTEAIKTLNENRMIHACIPYKENTRLKELDGYAEQKIFSIMAVDVQGDRLYYTIRDFAMGGNSLLIQHDMVTKWEQITEQRLKYDVNMVVVDSQYPERRLEVMDYCARNKFTFPIVASITSRKDEDVYKEDTDFDPFTGDSRAGKYYGQLKRIRFNSDYYKDLLHDLVEQRIKIKWMLPKDIDHIYLRHLAAEEKIDGEWTAVAKRNDYFDCECYCLLGATVLKLMKILD